MGRIRSVTPRFVQASLTLGALVAAAVFAASWRWHAAERSAPTKEDAASRSAKALHELEAELARVKTMVRANQLALQGHAPGTAEALAKLAHAGAGPEAAKPTHEEKQAADRERVERRARNVQATMRAQPRDDAWATDVEHHVRQRIGSLDRNEFPTTELESVNCRQSICEVRVSHETGAEAMAMFELISEVPTVSATFGKRDGDPAQAKLQTVVYLGREGHRLPQ